MKRITLVLLAVLLFCNCGKSRQEEKTPADSLQDLSPQESVDFDLDMIKKRGKLIALTRFNANSYFLYRGQPMGYEYELLNLLAKNLGVELEINVPKKWDDLIPMLYSGKGDIIAANLAITKKRSEKLLFTRHHSTTRQVLVQRKPSNWRKMKLHEIERSLVRSQIDLIGKKVFVRKGS